MHKSSSLAFTVPFRFMGSFLALIIVVAVVVASAFKAEAEVAIFKSDTYLEQGVEIVSDIGDKKQIQYEYLWSDFKGTVPEETVANSIVLRFSWSSVIRTVVAESATNTQTDVVQESSGGDTFTEASTTEVYVSESTLEEVIEVPEEIIDDTEQSVENDQELNDDNAPQENIEPTEPNTPIESDPEIVPSEEIGTEIDTDTGAENVEENPVEESTSPGEENIGNADTEGFEQVLQDRVYTWVNAELEESLIEETIMDTSVVLDDTVPEVIIAESISTTSGFVSSDIIVQDHAERSFEVRYAIDGITWHTLGSVGFDDSRETVFDISHIGLEALPNLQIAITYTVSEDDQTKIIFDAMHLEVDFTAPLLEEIIEVVAHDDRYPNFEVSAIKSDVHSENIRAVVLERGGIFEFWYSVTDTKTGVVFWNKILGGGAIDENAPIDIKKRTIFWLDRNQQTLFGFAVDEESIFAASFQNPENKVFLLPFTDDDGRQWEATFNSVQNELEFSRVKSE